jgi:PAS domain S-box-containing protein
MKEIKKTKDELLQELNALRHENAALKAARNGKTEEHNHIGDMPLNSSENSDFTGSKMDWNDEKNIRQLFDDYLRMYATRDDLLTTYFSENFSGFTGGGDFLVKNRDEWIAITRQDFSQVKDHIRIELKDVAIQSLSDTIAVTTGFFIIHLPIEDQILSRETARLVLIFRKESAGWKISHSSISIPYYLVRKGEVYPMKELVQRNKVLEELVAQRTIQLSEANDKLQYINEELAKEIAEHKQAEKAQQESEQKYHLLVDRANEAVIVIQDGMLKLNNPMTRIMTGYGEEEIGIIPFQKFVHPDDRTMVIDYHQKRLRGENVPGYYIFRLLDKNGTTHWVHMNAVLIDWEGSPATLNFMTDITELKVAEEALKQSNREWEAVITASPDGIGMISLDGNIKLISEKLVIMHGYSKDEMDEKIGRSIFDFIDSSNHQLLRDNVRKLLAGETDHRLTEYLAIKKDGSRFYIDVKTSVLLDAAGNPTSILYVERDITERKQAELIIQQQYKRMQELNNTKDKFFSIIAHDLRSPFQSLLSTSELLATEIERMSHEEIVSFSFGINNNLKSLYGLLENLLQWSMMQRNLLEYEPENLNLFDLTNKIIEISIESALKKNISISNNADTGTLVYADVYMLHSIIQNLITNAVKFTPIGGKITISSVQNGDFVEISVQDTGIGMEPGISSELFNFNKPFTTNGTAGEKGTGLGLSLCKEFVERNDGKIWVESELGKGSKFTFTLQKAE